MENNQYYPQPVSIMRVLMDSGKFTEADDDKIITVILDDDKPEITDFMSVRDFRKATDIIMNLIGGDIANYLSTNGIKLEDFIKQ